MNTEYQTVAVLTADVVRSRRYSLEDRQQVDNVLREAFADVASRFPNAIHTPMAFRITAGDEFQCVFKEISKVAEIIFYLRSVAAIQIMDPPLNFRASVGIGKISVENYGNSYTEDGPAFARAREGIIELQKGRRRKITTIRTGNEATDRSINVVLSLIDAVSGRWSVFQWEAIKWSLVGAKREDVAEITGIAHQNVTKKLAAALWPAVSDGLDFIREALNECSSQVSESTGD